jgi:hypothetical protein
MELTHEIILEVGFKEVDLDENDPPDCKKYESRQFYILISKNIFRNNEPLISLAVNYGYLEERGEHECIAHKGHAFIGSVNLLSYEDLQDVIRIFGL